MRHDNPVPVLGLDTRECAHAFAALLIIFSAVLRRHFTRLEYTANLAAVLCRFALHTEYFGDIVTRSQYKQFRIWIEFVEVARELLHDVVRHAVKRFVGNAQTTHFHACCLHLKRLARAYAMRDKRICLLHDAPYDVFLMCPQFYAAIHAWKRQVRAVVFAQYFAVEVGIVIRNKAFLARLVAPNPAPELIRDTFSRGISSIRLFLVQAQIFIVFTTVEDLDRFIVEQAFHEEL